MHADTSDAGRPYGTTREQFLATRVGPLMADWLEDVEARYGRLERIASLTLADDRIVVLARFAQAWMVNFSNPGKAPTECELQCFLSFEAMIGLWGLYQYLTTKETHESAWEAFLAARKPVPAAATPAAKEHTDADDHQ